MAVSRLVSIVVLAGWLGAPARAAAEMPRADDPAPGPTATAETVATMAAERVPTLDNEAWDGLVTLVVEYLDPNTEFDTATARVASTLETPTG